MTSSRNFMCM